MYHYLFTNDLRISVLDESLKKAGHCFVTNTVPSSTVDKSANNNMMTLGFYFTLTETSNCAKAAEAGNTRAVVLNFIKKFQFPNMRTVAAFNDAKNDGITLVPMRIIVKLLYTMNLLHGSLVAYLTKDEIKNFIFYNDNVAKKKNPDIGQLIIEILEYRKTGILPDSVSASENEHEWKHEDRQIREMLKVLKWSGCITEKDGNFIIDNDELSSRNKADVFDIITCDTFWEGTTIESYRDYMDMPDYVVDIEGKNENIQMTSEEPEERNKRLFRSWMELQVKPEGDSDAGNPYSKTAIDQYVSNIANTMLTNMSERSVFYTTDIGEVEITIETLDNSEVKNHTQRSAVKKYMEYLMQMGENDKEYEDILKHNLWGIHIKEKNDALSEENPHVCIGWSAMGDLSGLETTEDIMAVYEQHFNKNNRAKGQDVGMIRRFLKELQIGDYIIFAESSEFHIGRIESDYYYDDSENPNQSPDYTNNRKVIWLKKHISRKVISKAMHGSLATAMSIFCINDYRAAVMDLLRGTYKRDDDVEIDEGFVEEEFIEPDYNTGLETDFERNRIVFGAPGTGKSFKLKEEAEELIGCAENNMERVTFHSDYTYSQFVGTYKPVTGSDDKIRYDFVPGPFMRVYVNAIKNIQQISRVYDIIEHASVMYMFPTNPNPANEEEKWDLFEEIREIGQEESFHASKDSKVGDLALIYVGKTKPGYDNGIYAIGRIVGKETEDRAIIRFEYVSYYAPIIDYETLKEYKPNIRSNGKVNDDIIELVKETVIPANPNLLLIEEINRAKVSAVFGDVFQLLDRDEDGVSEYDIHTSEDIRKYLAKELGGTPQDWLKIRIPNNMFIWSTMNSADQGVFPMDTAFKRRWNFEYLGINENEEYIQGIGKIMLPDSDEPVEWNTLRKAINDKMSSADFKINEDKLMGPFFLTKNIVASDEHGMIINTEKFIKVFKSKVIMYLYEDAVKQGKHRFFEGCDSSKYSSVCEAFDEIGIGIFGATFRETFYAKQRNDV